MQKGKLISYFSAFEKGLLISSVIVIVAAFLLCRSSDYMQLAVSLVGAVALILNAKGNVLGQVLVVAFSVMYAIISYSQSYYGEMITYVGMTMPIAIASIVTWLRNPAENGKNEVKVNSISKREYLFLCVLSVAVTVAFYFILAAFNTAVLWLSTVSVFTSFAASYLTMRRSEFYAVAYAANDIVLIGLWAIAMSGNIEYLSVLICFVIFLVNDIYGFYSWIGMKRRQAGKEKKSAR